MRSIKQPGAPVTERIQWVEARGRAFSFTLPAGLPLLEAARRGFAAEGFAGGVLNFSHGALGPFGYVMPALSKTGENAAFYSDTYRPAGVTRTRLGSMTLGMRDGAPFYHCHGLWTEADGKASGGHMLPDETVDRRAVRGRGLRRRWRDVHRRARPRDQFQAVRAGRRPRAPVRVRPAAPSRCGCGPTRILPSASKLSAGRTASRVQKSTAASARPSARASPMAA